MKKIAKVLLLGVILMVPAGLSAGPPTFVTCSMGITIVTPGSVKFLIISQEVPIRAVSQLEAAGWSCEDPG